MTTGERIKAARKTAGMTQAELASKLDIPFQSISQWERDVRKPKKETLAKIADALNIHPAMLSDDQFDSDFLSLLQQKMRPDEDFRTAFIGGFIQLAILRGDNDMRLMEGYDMLNERGQRMAVDYVQDLAEKAEYLKDIYTKTSSELKDMKEVTKPLPHPKNKKPPQD